MWSCENLHCMKIWDKKRNGGLFFMVFQCNSTTIALEEIQIVWNISKLMIKRKSGSLDTLASYGMNH